MGINDMMRSKGMTKYRLAKVSGVPYATINDLCNGKSNINKCSAETLYKIARTLDVTMETILEADAIEKSYEYGLPQYLQDDLDNFKRALKKQSGLIDCYWGELYGSINIAEINEGLISHEHAEYLRKKYLWGNK